MVCQFPSQALKESEKNMAAVMKVTTKHAKVDTAIDTEFIYAHVLGIMVTSGIRFC